MAKLFVSDLTGFNPGTFIDGFDGLNGTTVKTEGDLWKVAFDGGEAFVRGDDFKYDKNGTPNDISDDIIKSGDITSFSFNTTEVDPSQAVVRIRDIDGLSGSQVHDALVSGDSDAAFAVFRTIFKGDDVLHGGAQGDYLAGFKGDDKIKGGGGSDVLIGGKGEDRMYAGGGDPVTGDNRTDQFVFANGDSAKNAAHADRIYQFINGEDFIDVSQTGAHKKDVHIDHHDGNSYITIDAHDGHDKMMIVVVDNVDIHKDSLAYGNIMTTLV